MNTKDWKKFSDLIDAKNSELMRQYFSFSPKEREERDLKIDYIAKTLENYMEWKVGKLKF